MENESDICPNPILLEDFDLADVVVRLARSDERCCWDALMNKHHYLGFKQFYGRGLRYVFEYKGRWLGLAGWQPGFLKCAPRDKWIGWNHKLKDKRLHLIANNTRFLILGPPGAYPNLATFALAQMCHTLSFDWEARYGHQLLLAETFVEQQLFSGSMYKASGWVPVGQTKGFSRANGGWTDRHGKIKDIYVRPLRRDACRLLCASDSLSAQLSPMPEKMEPEERPELLVSLYKELLKVEDFRRPQGRKHSIATVLAVYMIGILSKRKKYAEMAEFAKTFTQSELKSINAWLNPKTNRYVPVSKSTLQRVLAHANNEELLKLLARYSKGRRHIGQALAADGKRIRAANRNSDNHYETATLVEHGTGLPVASLPFHEKGGEIAAVQSLLEKVDIAGQVITVDALHTVRNTAKAIVEKHGADYLMTVKKNAPETFETLSTIDWEKDETDFYEEPVQNKHGRIEQRRIRTLTSVKGAVNYPHVAQLFRVERYREEKKTGGKKNQIVYGITSVPSERGTPKQLLEWNRGHWSVENLNHRARDTVFKEDACLATKGNAPANRAICNNIALAVIINKGHKSVAQTTQYYNLNRKKVFQAILKP